MPWPDYCREVLEEDRPGWIDYLIDTEDQLKGKGYAEARSAQERAKNPKRIATKAEAGAKGGRGNKAADNISSFSHGTGADYLTARIARDRPDILERMKAGEYRSVRQAAIEAGIVKVPTTLEKLVKLWAKATPEERREFCREGSDEIRAFLP